MLEQGPLQHQLLRDAYKSRMPVPDKFKNAPDLLPGVELYFTGYLELASFAGLPRARRQIVWADVRAYALDHGFDEEQRFIWFECVAALDREWLGWEAKKRTRGNGNRNKAALATHPQASPRHR